jgi:hypothetical protein
VSIIVSAPDALPHLTFFADASSRERDFMVAGGFAVAGSRIAEIESHVAALRDAAGISEFHWSDYNGRHKDAYEALIDYAFGLVEKNHAHLHIIIAKFKGYKHKAKPGENRDTSINRMYFQLALHRPCRFYGHTRAIHLRLDHGNDSADMCEMRAQLCAKAYDEYKTPPNCVRSIQSVSSDQSGIIQMADVILGAAAAKRNEIVHTSPKGPLADFVLKRSRLPSWHVSTGYNAKRLTVWNHKGKWERGPS